MQPSQQPSRGTVLVVDDDEDARHVLAAVVETDGYSVLQAENAAEAIAVIEGSEPLCAVLVDMLMPGIIGTSLLDYLAHEPRFAGVPVAVVTGSPHLVPAGYTVFGKPIDGRALRGFLARASRPTA